MRLLDRYLLREMLIPFGYCLCGFLMFRSFADIFTELVDFQKGKLLPAEILEYYLLKMPGFLVEGMLPMALLLALLYALTSHARHNELTAIRAAGVSLWRLCLPYLGVGFLASLLLFMLNELCVPNSEEAAEQILSRHAPPPPGSPGRRQVAHLGFTNSREGRLWQIGLYNSDTGEMVHPYVRRILADGSICGLHAERAARANDVWIFYDVREFREDVRSNSFPTPLLQTNVLVMPEFSETPEQINSEIKLAGSISLRKARSADMPIKDILNYLRLHPDPVRADQWWLYTKLQGRFAAPWTCLVVVLIAIPFGVAYGRRNVFAGVASSILICASFFVLVQIGLLLGSSGYLTPWLAAWSPNLAFGLAGLWMTTRVR